MNRVNFYMGILYYYGIASSNYLSNPREASVYFEKSSKPIASFYLALCSLAMAGVRALISDEMASDIKEKLHRAKMATENEVTKYLYGTLMIDADYFIHRLDNSGSPYDKEREAYSLVDTRDVCTEKSVKVAFSSFYEKKVRGQEKMIIEIIHRMTWR